MNKRLGKLKDNKKVIFDSSGKAIKLAELKKQFKQSEDQVRKPKLTKEPPMKFRIPGLKQMNRDMSPMNYAPNLEDTLTGNVDPECIFNQ